METIILFAMLCNVVLLIYIAGREKRGLKFLLLTLSGYWFLSFFLRPILFLYSRNHDIRSSVYDFRIGQSPTNFISVMSPIVIGCFIFCLPLLIWNLKSKTMEYKSVDFKDFSWVIHYGIIVGLFSAVVEQSIYRNPFSKSLVNLIPFCLCALLWQRKTLQIPKINQIFIVFSSSISILMLATKSGHFKGILLTPVLVLLSTLSLWGDKEKKFKRLLTVFFTFLLSVPFFSVLQNRKLGSVAVSEFNSYGDAFPWYLSPFLTLCVRFDQFARTADAHFAGSGALGGFTGWIKYILVNLEWNPGTGRTDLSFGNAWNQLVTNRTVPGARFSPVSLAQGMIGEGLIWAGFSSLIIECLLLSLVFIWVGKLLDSGVLSIIFAFGIIGNSTLFEAGVVQAASSFSSILKIIFFLWISLKISTVIKTTSVKNISYRDNF